jgi:hypothetical protein
MDKKQTNHENFEKMANLRSDILEEVIEGEKLERTTIEDALYFNNKYLPWTIYPQKYSRKFLVEKFNEVFGTSIK